MVIVETIIWASLSTTIKLFECLANLYSMYMVSKPIFQCTDSNLTRQKWLLEIKLGSIKNYDECDIFRNEVNCTPSKDLWKTWCKAKMWTCISKIGFWLKILFQNWYKILVLIFYLLWNSMRSFYFSDCVCNDFNDQRVVAFWHLINVWLSNSCFISRPTLPSPEYSIYHFPLCLT